MISHWFLMRAFLCILVALILTGGCSREGETSAGGGATMGTTWSLHTLPPLRQQVVQDLQRQLDDWESMLSHWRADSAVTRFNGSTSTAWVAVPAEVVEVVELAQQIGAATDHALDITVAPLIELWGFGATGARSTPPTAAEIAAARARCGWRHLHVRQDPPALRKDIPGLRINVSAVAEGWALDRLARQLESKGIQHFLLEIGGEVLTRGKWPVGVADPGAPSGLVAQTVVVENQSVATSGVYRQRFHHDGKEYAHVIDPRTGRPVEHALASVTVIHPSAAQADGHATALLVLGPEEGRRLAKKLGLGVLWFERLQ